MSNVQLTDDIEVVPDRFRSYLPQAPAPPRLDARNNGDLRVPRMVEDIGRLAQGFPDYRWYPLLGTSRKDAERQPYWVWIWCTSIRKVLKRTGRKFSSSEEMGTERIRYEPAGYMDCACLLRGYSITVSRHVGDADTLWSERLLILAVRLLSTLLVVLFPGCAYSSSPTFFFQETKLKMDLGALPLRQEAQCVHKALNPKSPLLTMYRKLPNG